MQSYFIIKAFDIEINDQFYRGLRKLTVGLNGIELPLRVDVKISDVKCCIDYTAV